MHLSKIELKILEQIANGNNNIDEIAKILKKDKSRIYRGKKTLTDKNLITFSKKTLEPTRMPMVTLLLQLLSNHPNIKPILSNSGIPILTNLLEKKTIKEIEQNTTFQKSIIYKKIQQALTISIIQKTKRTYKINKNLWNDLADFLKELKTYDQTIDPRIPVNSKIYHKNEEEIIFSNNQNIDASMTGFSAYKDHGIILFLPTNYYLIPKKTLSINEIFLHSLLITEKEKTIRHLIFIALFFLKNKSTLTQINHPILKNIQEVLQGKNLPGYPNRNDIIEKADLYDIKI